MATIKLMDHLRMLRYYYNIVAIFCLLCLTGCLYKGPERLRPFASIDTPYKAEQQSKVTEESYQEYMQRGWWTLYKDEELNKIIQLAFTNNPDLNQIRARLAQANASATKAKSTLLPSITVTGDRGTQNGDNAQNSDFNLAGAASYEIDLWGENRSNKNATSLEFQASREDVYASAISLSAEIVENWLEILSLLEQESLLRNQIDLNETVLNLQEKRFEMGSSSALDILQQEEVLAQSESQLPDILSAQEQAANNIAILIGSTPYNGLKITEKPFPSILAIAPNGLPSDLITNRPDIQAAWMRLQSSDWAAKAAWADRLPSFNLSSSLSMNTNKIDGLFSSWLLDIALGLTAPVFDGQNRKAEQLRQEAVSDELFHAYRAVVLDAIIDVENSLVKNHYQDNKMTALKKQLQASKRTLEQAQLSYTNGDSDYINVLNSIKSTQSLEQSIVTEKLQQAKNRVQLYRALGGRNWAAEISLNPSETIIEKIYESQPL